MESLALLLPRSLTWLLRFGQTGSKASLKLLVSGDTYRVNVTIEVTVLLCKQIQAISALFLRYHGCQACHPSPP